MFTASKLKWISVIVMILLIGFGFYWTSVRPVLVKKQCSWYTYTEPAQEATGGITQEEADRMNRDNKNTNPFACGQKDNSRIFEDLFLECKPTNIQPESPKPAKSEQEITRPANKVEYENCLRHKGF